MNSILKTLFSMVSVLIGVTALFHHRLMKEFSINTLFNLKEALPQKEISAQIKTFS